MKKPFFSIVIPTKDRPECVKIILDSIKRQTYGDYEVIISDNALAQPCKEVYDEVAEKDDRFSYFRNESVLGICDSFEAAIRHVRGKWIMMFGDKNILYPDALEKLCHVLLSNNPEILNFGSDFLDPIDPDSDLLYGKLKKIKRSGKIEPVNPKDALKAHFSMHNLMAGTERLWYVGSIYAGGVYQDSFVEKIRSLHDSGRVFDGIIPDRYGAAEALCYANNVLWLDDHICIYNACGKHTWGGTIKKGMKSVNAFVKESRKDKDYTEKLQIPGVIASVNNIVASDYYNAVQNAISSNECQVSEVNISKGYLAALVEKELLNTKNISDVVREQQQILADAYIRKLNESEKSILNTTRKEMKRRSARYGVKSSVNCMLKRWMCSERIFLRTMATKLELFFSKDTFIIKGLSDL